MKKSLFILLISSVLITACGGNDGPSVSSSEATGSCQVARADTSGGGRNVGLICDGNSALRSGSADLISSIPVSFGQAGASYSDTSRGTARRQSNDSLACERAFVNAVLKLQKKAQKIGKSSVTNIQGYNDKQTVGGGQYRCTTGTWHATVVLHADYR